MSLLRCFQPCSSLLTPPQMGIGERATTEVNAAVVEVISDLGYYNGKRGSATLPFLTKTGQRLGGMLQRTAA